MSKRIALLAATFGALALTSAIVAPVQAQDKMSEKTVMVGGAPLSAVSRDDIAKLVGYVGQITQSEYVARKSLGYTSNDVVGKDGLEAVYDSVLQGRSGGRRIKVNSAGEAVANVSDFPPVPGNSLQLTLDWNLQQATENAMAAQLRTIAKLTGRALAGSVIVEDPNNGEILALVSQPNFNPNDFAAGIPEKKYAQYLSDPLHPLFDRVISGAYPTGSTFKMIVSSAVLASGLMGSTSTRYCGGAYDLNGFIFNDDRAGGHGTLDIPTAVAQSCDVFFYQVGNQLGIERLDRNAQAFGIGWRTGIDLPGETQGTLPSPRWTQKVYKDQWYAGDTVNMAVGQGFLEASPVQMLRVVAAVANGGSLYAPHFVRAVLDARGRVRKSSAQNYQGQVPVPAADLQIVRRGMLGAIESDYGTAHNVMIPGYHFAGKTGTAEIGIRGKYDAWFIAFAPADNPRVAVAVAIENASGFGGAVAAPIAKSLMQAILASKSNP